MKIERSHGKYSITCDVCARQMVLGQGSDEYVCPREGMRQTDIDTHICGDCAKDPLVKEQENIS